MMRRLGVVIGMIILLLLLVIGDIAVRFMLSGHFEPFFNSLAIFTLDFSCILLLVTSIRNLILHQHVQLPYGAIIAVFLLLIADVSAIAVRSSLHDRTRQHLQQLLADRLRDPSRVDLLSEVGNELVDVEVFHCQEHRAAGATARLLTTIGRLDLMARLNGNRARRETFASMLQRLDLLKPDASIGAEDLMLPADEMWPWLWIASICAILTLSMYACLVYSVATPDLTHQPLSGIVNRRNESNI